MKKYIFAILALFYLNSSFAQQDSLPVYKRHPTVPPFSIIKVPDSSIFTKAGLDKRKATIIMVFSPDCDHCQRATEDLLAHMDLFKKVQIVMASPLEYKFVLPFYNTYKIAAHPNIFMGWDRTYFFGTFYQVRNFPSIFLYDKKGNFVKSFEGSVSFEKIAESL